MDDLQLLIYIIFIVLFILSRALRKKKPVSPDNAEQNTGGEQASARPASKRPVTFEDLLRELERLPPEKSENEEWEESKVVESVDQKETENQYPTYATYESQEEQSTIDPEYEKYLKDAGMTPLDEQIDIEEPLKKRFEEYRIQQKEHKQNAARYKQLLKDPETLKDAIILQEILKRKYS